jgi:hypothetical protein
LADAPDLGFRNRRFHRVPFRFETRPIYEGKTQFFTISTAFTTDEEKRRHSSTISSTRISLSSCENPSKLAICRTVIAPEADHRWHAFYVCPSVQIEARISGGSSKCASAYAVAESTVVRQRSASTLVGMSGRFAHGCGVRLFGFGRDDVSLEHW